MLLRKAVRTMWGNRKSYLACIFLIAVGILMQIALTTAVAGLEQATNRFYRNYRLADVFAQVERIPMGYTDTLEQIPGVARAQVRSVVDARCEVPGNDEIITLRLVSIDPAAQDPINDLDVIGQIPRQQWDLAVNPAFAEYHGLMAGDTLSVYLRGREYELTMSGVAMSPEHVYVTSDITQVLPDEGGFGIGYITEAGLTRITGEQGWGNEVVFTLEDGYTFDQVKLALEDSLKQFGIRSLTDREDQLSYAFLDMEISSVKSMSTAMPMLFLLMAVVVLYLMLKRVVEQDRTQIGMLKAFGFSSREIIRHYLLYGGVTGVLGGLAGWVMGYFASGAYLEMFLQYFRLPSQGVGFDYWSIFPALGLALCSGLLGAGAGARKVVGLIPAEAMRPESPKPVKFDLVGKIGVLGLLFTSRGHMALRSMLRSPLRSMFLVVSMTGSFALLTIVGSIGGMIDKMIYSQFTELQRYQVRLTLDGPLSYDRAVADAYKLAGVSQAEGIFEWPVELWHNHLRHGVMVTGIEGNSSLYRVADTNTKERYTPPENGMILSNAVAQELQVGGGDVVMLSTPLLKDEVPVRVIRVIEQNLGSGCYMELESLAALLGQPKSATALILNTGDLEGLKEELKKSDVVTSIDDKESTLQKYKTMMGMFDSLYLVIGLMGTLVAFAIIYNTSVISLSERKREYATLRVVGLTVREVAEIMNLEYVMLGAMGMLLGIPFANFLNRSMNLLVDNNMFTMPSTLPATAYLTGLAGCVAAMYLSSRSSRRKIATFDMVEVLKERE